jgi:signal transduction histidine kinase
MSRLPIRLRVTLAFAAAMALVLAAVGAFLYIELQSRLDESVDDDLETRAIELAIAVAREEGGRSTGYALAFGDDEADDDSFNELLTAEGLPLRSTRQGVPMDEPTALTPDEADRAREDETTVERASLPGVEGSVRMLAFPIDTGRRQLIGVVGRSLEDRDEALSSLAILLAIGLPAALALASLAGYLALGAALRPVEAMRRRAAEISAGERDERLPVPAARDELRRLGETLNEMLARLEGALERERRFVDDASHELRTPLTLHKTELELALRQGEGEEELRAAIASALEEVDRLVQLAEDLLVVARSDEEGLALNPETIAAAELLGRIAERFRSRVEQAGRELVPDASRAPAPFLGDRLRLEQALTSLVDNGLRHGAGDIRLSASVADGRVVLRVSDEGEGFPPELLDHAFERFTRADTARSRGGTGLGLSIVEAIAHAHGGSAYAANRPGGGADVWIEIPLREAL